MGCSYSKWATDSPLEFRVRRANDQLFASCVFEATDRRRALMLPDHNGRSFLPVTGEGESGK